MSERTGIEWTDHTFNPWWGCEKVSPGCAHCYAEGVSNRYEGPGLWGAGHRFRFFGEKHWQAPLRWNRRAEAEGVRRRVFCASMADVFEERPELEEHRARLFDLIEQTPLLDWQVLTKRPEFARDWIAREGWAAGLEPRNVWMGVSIENARHTWRADVLRAIPAAVRFISAEPLLGSLFERASDLTYGRAIDRSVTEDEAVEIMARARRPLDLTGIDWVIVGGESGKGARPFDVGWAREIVSACRLNADGAPAVFVKQLGAMPLADIGVRDGCGAPVLGKLNLRDRKGGDWDEWPADLRVREFPASAKAAA